MRKRFILILSVIFLTMLAGCRQDEIEPISMIVPFGSTQFAQLDLQNDSVHYEVDVVSGPDVLSAAFVSKTHDVIIAPTNLGAILFHNNQNYMLFASIVWGNLYLVSKDVEIASISDLEGKTVTVFGQNQTPDMILSFIIDTLEIDVTIEYVDSVTTAQGLLASGQKDIILTAEPALSALKNNLGDLHQIDVQQAYQDITGETSYPQASVFIKSNLSLCKIQRLEKDLPLSIENANQQPEQQAELAVSLGMNLPQHVIAQAITQSNLMYVTAEDAKESIITYFEMILQNRPALIGNQLPSDDFYFKK